MERRASRHLSLQSGVRISVSFSLACIFLQSFCSLLPGQQVGSSTGQDLPASLITQKPETSIRVHSDLVLIPVTVTDKSGKAISGLEKEHFTLLEDNAPQEITHFAAEDAPVSVAVVFDASDSMSPKLAKAREAVQILLNKLNPESESSLIRVGTVARVLVPLTGELQAVKDIAADMRVGGSTALLDGVHLAMTEMAKAKYLRKAIIIISDGEDNASHWTVKELKTAVREQDILIYAIALTDAGMADYSGSLQENGLALLRDIASQSGGYTFTLSKPQQLPGIADKIGGWLRNQYMLGYVPSRSATDGSYRKIQLKLTRPKGYPRMQAVWRRGYFAPKE